MKFYRQCLLKSGNTEMTTWIEERGAKDGYWVSLEDYPEQLWKVVKAYSHRMSERALQEANKTARTWRKQVDI